MMRENLELETAQVPVWLVRLSQPNPELLGPFGLLTLAPSVRLERKTAFVGCR